VIIYFTNLRNIDAIYCVPTFDLQFIYFTFVINTNPIFNEDIDIWTLGIVDDNRVFILLTTSYCYCYSRDSLIIVVVTQ